MLGKGAGETGTVVRRRGRTIFRIKVCAIPLI